MRRMQVILPMLALLGAAACGDDDPSGTPTPAPTATPSPSPTPTPTPVASVERAVSPTLVDPRVTTFTADNIVINPASTASPKGRLIVMLPGTGATPSEYRLILREGVAQGYHAIGLMYPNDPAIEALCGANGADSCTGDGRREIVTGADTSTLVTISAGGSIVDRLTALLNYLVRTAPNEGWGSYIANGQPDWSRIVVAGHSQGAGHAAFMGKLYSLYRIAMFSGPADKATSSWLSAPNITPASRVFGFIHSGDTLVPPPRVQANWTTQQLDGPVVQLDGTARYTGPSHQLTTAVAPQANSGSPIPEHLSTVADRATPLTSAGTAQFLPIWDYMAFTAQ